jgi:hypothetical protein
MSDEQRKDQEPEVEGHVRSVSDEPAAEGEENDEVEAHVRAQPRAQKPRA